MRRSLARIRYRRALPTVPALPGDARPEISIVLATFNRSNVLAIAIETVLAQTFTDWELIVVGDACTDDTADVVAAFGDPRIHFVDLPQNLGDQSGPNSVGGRLARGRFVAWLSHDDLWFPDHLATLREVVLDGADLALAPYVRLEAIRPEGKAGIAGGASLTWIPDGFEVEAGTVYPASTWLMRRQLLARLGDWCPGRSVRYASSQELLYRAWSSGARIAVSRVRTAVIVPSVIAAGAYAGRHDAEQSLLKPLVLRGDRAAVEALETPGALFDENGRPHRLSIRAEIGVPERRRPPHRQWLRDHSDGIYWRSARHVARLGVAPWEYAGYLVDLPSGGSLRQLRSRRGL